jgi:hypothetical protein
VLGTQEDDLVLSYPKPPLESPLLGQPLEITFLCREEAGPRRYGYYSLVLDTLDDFPGPQGLNTAMVVLYPRQQDLISTNLRQAKRYRIGPQSELTVFVDGISNIEILDISLKGLRFRHNQEEWNYSLDERIQLYLNLYDRTYAVSGRVVRTALTMGGQEVSVALDTLRLDLWSELLQLVQDLHDEQEATTH